MTKVNKLDLGDHDTDLACAVAIKDGLRKPWAWKMWGRDEEFSAQEVTQRYLYAQACDRSDLA